LLRQTGTVLSFYQAIDARRLYLSPKPTDNDCLLVFKRGLKEKIRHRIEFLPDNLVPSIFKEYALFADKSEREGLATAKRVPFFKPRQSFIPTKPNIYIKVAPRKGYDQDGDIEITLNANMAYPKRTSFSGSKPQKENARRPAAFKPTGANRESIGTPSLTTLVSIVPRLSTNMRPIVKSSNRSCRSSQQPGHCCL
jgi:hypothetical protein